MADWVVSGKADLAKLITYFDRFPLRAKKARDYAVWREGVCVYLVGNRRSPELHDCYDRLRLVRQYEGVGL